MRSFIVAISIALALILGSILYSNNLVRESEHLSHLNDNIITSLEAENYERAKLQLAELQEQVEKFKVFFFATDNHSEIDNIKLNLAELEKFIEKEVQSDALAKANVLSFLFSHLPENTELKLGNIF